VVLTHPNEATAIEVPYPIEDWAGRGFTPDPGQVAGDFYISVRRGEKVCFVSPLAEKAQRTLQLVMRSEAFPIELRPAPQDYAFRKVVFFDAIEEQRQFAELAEKAQQKMQSSEEVQRLRTAPRQPLAPASDELQLGLLRTMQMLANMSEQQARKVVASNPALSWAKKDGKPVDAGDFTLATRFVIRNEAMKAIGIACEVTNKTKRRLTFLADSFVVRSGKCIYPATATDFNPVVEPGATNVAFFAVARTPDGSPLRLAVETPVQVSLALATSASVHPSAAVTLQDVLSPEEAHHAP
jgi:hypothetical protein